MTHSTAVPRALGLCLAMVWGTPLVGQPAARLTPTERGAGFRLLFDGRSFSGWKQQGNWTIVERSLFRARGGGGLTYVADKVPDDFELRFQWKVARGSNSGVYYRPGQYEYQILDNAVHVDGKNPRTSAASLYFCMAPSRDVTRPVGKWNDARIVCQGSIIQHWLNGEKVIDFDYTDKRWAEHVTLLKRRGGDLPARGRQLFLQDHGDPVWYRALRLRSIPSGEKIAHTTVRPAPISPEIRKAEEEKLRRIAERRGRTKAAP